MGEALIPLFVRLSVEQAERLDRAVAAIDARTARSVAAHTCSATSSRSSDGSLSSIAWMRRTPRVLAATSASTSPSTWPGTRTLRARMRRTSASGVPSETSLTDTSALGLTFFRSYMSCARSSIE